MVKRSTVLLIAILAVVMALGVGFAAITSTQLNITGNTTATPDQANFKVKFLEETEVSDPSKVEAVVTGDITATIDVHGLSAKGDTVTATYKVKNFSDDLSADIEVDIKSNNEEYFKITPELGQDSLRAGEETTVVVTVELIKTLIRNDETSKIIATIEATPVQPGEEGTTIGQPDTNGAKTLVQAFKDGEIEVGDYITNYNDKLYNQSASAQVTAEETGYTKTQTYRVDTNTTWRVLGLSEDETQLIITTGSPIKKVEDGDETGPYLALGGAEGWYNTNDEIVVGDNILDRISNIYDSDLAEKAQSMRIEDIMTVLDLTLDKENNKLYKTTDSGRTEISSYQGFFGQTYTYKLGTSSYNMDYAPENYLKEKYSAVEKYNLLPTRKAGDTVDGTAFMFVYEEPSVVEQNSKLFEILFKGTTESDKYAKSYWLASPGVYVDGSSGCNFSPGIVNGGRAAAGGGGLFSSHGFSFVLWFAVRPVVYLWSDVSVEDLEISKNGTEADWTTSLEDNSIYGDAEYGQITE